MSAHIPHDSTSSFCFLVWQNECNVCTFQYILCFNERDNASNFNLNKLNYWLNSIELKIAEFAFLLCVFHFFSFGSVVVYVDFAYFYFFFFSFLLSFRSLHISVTRPMPIYYFENVFVCCFNCFRHICEIFDMHAMKMEMPSNMRFIPFRKH